MVMKVLLLNSSYYVYLKVIKYSFFFLQMKVLIKFKSSVKVRELDDVMEKFKFYISRDLCCSVGGIEEN